MTAAPSVEVREPSRRRRMGIWISTGIIVIVIGAVGGALAGLGGWAQRGALDPDSAGPLGTRAVVELLRQQGVDVVVTREREVALRELSLSDATLVLPDAPALSDRGISQLGDTAMDLVLIDPTSRDLRVFVPGATLAGVGSVDPVPPACDLSEAERSGAVAPGGLFEPSGGDVTACYRSGDGYGLLVTADGEHRISAVDAFSLFTNESLADHGNAALALNLLGRHDVVVWYMPSVADTDLADTTPSLGDLTPPWVSPAIVLLLLAGAAAAIWQGRRFGPLVAERLPVTVRASETTEGRGRLYANAHDSPHAADQLRIGALTRLARVLALGPAASAIEIADAAARRVGRDRGAIRRILIDDVPRNDSDLLTLRADLRDLEAAVQSAVRPERNPR